MDLEYILKWNSNMNIGPWQILTIKRNPLFPTVWKSR